MNFSIIHGFISQSYWAKGMPAETLHKALDNSICFGVLTEHDEQAAFARIVTDQATFAYLADVFVLDQYRGKGVSKWLIKTIIEHPNLQGLRRIMLATQDAHGLYEQFGFKAINEPELLMQIHNPDVYLRKPNQ